MRKLLNPWLITVLYISLALGFGIGLGFGVRRLPDVGQPRSDTVVWIYSGHDISQILTPVHNGLNVVTVYMRNISLRNRLPMTFRLTGGDGRTIREINLNGYNIGDGDSVRFQFAPVADSGGKTYRLVFSSPGSVMTDAVGIGSSGGDISYQAYYFPAGRFGVVGNVLAAFAAGVLRPGFLVLFVILGFLSLGFGLWVFSYV